MRIEAFYHGPKNNWCYAYNKETLHIRFRTKRDDVWQVELVCGDKYDWSKTTETHQMEKAASDSIFDYWEVCVKPKYRRLSYAFKITAGSETLWMIETGITHEEPYPPGGYYDFPYLHECDVFQAPAWAKEAIFYQIFPERFGNGDTTNDPPGTEPWGGEPSSSNFFGGDLQGIIDRLDYLVDLGINAIYCTPIFTSSSNHKYDTIDYRQVDVHFGDNELLKKLVEECHSRGIRVVLDAVFNHCGEHFPPFQDVLQHGVKSRFKDWFHVRQFPLEVIDGIPTYDTFGFYPGMPKFNTANPEVEQYLLTVAEYWIKEVKIDGWRLDVANEVNHQFWRKFRQVVKEADPDAYIVGEVWNDSIMWLLGDQFDSVMNYPFSNKILEFFAGDHMDGSGFADSIGSLLIRYPQQANEVVFNLLCSHDTPRALTICHEDKRRLKLAVVFLLTYMGTPCIFYGDEIGLKGGADPDCRKCMEWDTYKQDRELYDFYKLIIHLRRQHKALREGRFRFLKADADDRRVIYDRKDERDHFIIFMNNTADYTTLFHACSVGGWRDALSEEEVPTVDGKLIIGLDQYGYRILYRSLS